LESAVISPFFSTTSKKERLEEYMAISQVPDLTAEEIGLIDGAGLKKPFRKFVRASVVYFLPFSNADFIYRQVHFPACDRNSGMVQVVEPKVLY
jgi:hypothetical protein